MKIMLCGDPIKIYKTKVADKDVIIYRTLIGAPATTCIMEELHSRGVNTFIIFGSCGELTSNIKKGAFIIPTEAYRDEGTSYHYLPASEFIKIDSSKELEEIFKEKNIPYESTKIWTTDALYKETTNKLKDRVSRGCKVVDMECASIMAVAKSRGFKAYQFLYTDDTLDNNSWDIKTLKDDRTDILKKCLDISFEIIKKI